MNKLLLTTAILTTLASPVVAQNADFDGTNTNRSNNANTNNNRSGANSNAQGGDSANQNLNVIDGSEEVDSFYLNLQQVYPKNLNNLQNQIRNNMGSVICQGDVKGSSVRIGFPPSIVFDKQEGVNEDCEAALAMMSNYTQSEILVNVVAYIQSLDTISPEYKRMAIEEITHKIMKMYLSDADSLKKTARKSTIQKVKTVLIENTSNWEERSRLAKEQALIEGRQVPLDYVPPELPPLDQCDMNNPND